MRELLRIRRTVRTLLPKAMIIVIGVAIAEKALAQGTADVYFQGKVVDSRGQAVPGATVRLMESQLATTTDAQGAFALEGALVIGIVRRALLPGGLRMRFRDGILSLENSSAQPPEMELIGPDGRRRRLPVTGKGAGGEGPFQADLARHSGGAAGVHWLRIGTGSRSTTFRYSRRGRGDKGTLFHGRAERASLRASAETERRHSTPARVGIPSADTVQPALVLEVSAPGFLDKRFVQQDWKGSSLTLGILPVTATLKERILDFIGEGNTLRLAFLKPESPGSRKNTLYHADLDEMAEDTLPVHAFSDSRGPEASPYGANAPSWSPDGRFLAYEIGTENATTNVSRIHIQPLQGPRIDGPGVPATNPRWWTDGADTSLIWCTSGREDAWADTASATYMQRIAGGTLSGEPVSIAKGSYNAGLSPDGRFLATAYRYGLVLDRETGIRRHLHVYPGHPPDRNGFPTDSMQACNGSVSQDGARPGRMLFLDFGVVEEPVYPNIVTPKLYAQHRMILIGEHGSEAPGRIVDFIDSPASELARERTWDDPEWTNAADFAVATTRDPEGDLTNPSEPRPTQPDIYLIKLSTKETLKVYSGTHQTMPAAWIGPENP